MSTAGNIGGFTKGLVAGGSLGLQWQDRKRRQKLEDEDRELRKEDRALRLEDRAFQRERLAKEDEWRAEERNYTREERAYSRAERERERAEKDAIKKVNTDAYNAAKEAQQAAIDANSQPLIEGDAPMPPMGLSGATGVAPARPASRGVTPAPAGLAGRGMRPAGPPVPGAVDPAVGAPPPLPATDQPQEPYGRARIGLGTVLTNPPAAAPQPPAPGMTPIQAPGGYPASGGQQPAPPVRGMGRQPTPPAPMPMPDGTPGPATAPNGLARAPVPSAADGPAVTPSVEVAAAAADSAPKGQKIVKTAEDFLTHYRETAVPMIVDHYLSTGNVEMAEKFQVWADSKETQAGQLAWGRGMIAARVGDAEGAFENFAEAFNTDGYFEDNYEVDMSASGLVKNGSGEIGGAYITVKDRDTGESQKIEFGSLEELTEFASLALSPEAVWEQGVENIKAAEELRKEELEHQRALEIKEVEAGYRAADKTKTLPERIREESKVILENDPSAASLSPEELAQKALANVQAQEQAAAGGLARPASRGLGARLE